MKKTQKAVDNLKASLREVLDMLDEHGPSILPHLCDSDENAGQRLRYALKECGLDGVNNDI